MSVRNFDGEIKSLRDTPFGYTIDIISGKWKLVIIYYLAEHQHAFFNEIKTYIGNISDKTLSESLKELEEDEIIEKKRYPGASKRAEYLLTERGWTLVPIIEELCYWGVDHMDDL